MKPVPPILQVPYEKMIEDISKALQTFVLESVQAGADQAEISSTMLGYVLGIAGGLAQIRLTEAGFMIAARQGWDAGVAELRRRSIGIT